MASMRDIKTRIRSVNSTKQITKAVHLVAAAKIRRAKEHVETSRPFFEKMHETIGSIIQNTKDLQHAYLEVRRVENTAYIVIAADRGLCGGYNSNLLRFVKKHMEDKRRSVLFTVGQKTKDFFKKYEYELQKSYVHISEEPTYEDARDLGQLILSSYLEGKIDEVYLCYTKFISMVSQEPKAIKILPLDPKDIDSQKEAVEPDAIMNFEPSPESVLDYVVPKYINSIIYGALLEAAASEQAAKMTAMDNATENAIEMIDTLTLNYNRARQAAITQEIAEIVGGAAAQG